MTASIRHVHSPLRATNCALSATRSMVKASTAAAMQVLFQDFRNSNQTQPSAAKALGAAKGRGYGLMIWLSCFAPPCPPCLAAVGLARFNDPPGTPSLETHGRFSALRHAKAMFGVACCSPSEKIRPHALESGRTRSHPVTPGHTRPHPATPGGADDRKKKMHHGRGMLQNDSESHDFAKGVAQTCH